MRLILGLGALPNEMIDINPDFEKENEYAVDLAYFLNELHGIKLIQVGLSNVEVFH